MRVYAHEQVNILKKAQCRGDGIRYLFDRDSACATLDSTAQRTGENACAETRCNPTHSFQFARPQSATTDQERDALSQSSCASQPHSHRPDLRLRYRTQRGASRSRPRRWSYGIPRRIRRQDQRGHARQVSRRRARLRSCKGNVIGPRDPADEVRHRLGERFNVRRQGGIEAKVVRRVVANHIDDRRPRSPCVVQIGEPICESRTEVQQRRRGPIRHATVAIRRAGYHILLQAEDTAHARLVVERRDKMHFRRSGVRKADAHTVVEQCVAHRLCTVHR